MPASLARARAKEAREGRRRWEDPAPTSAPDDLTTLLPPWLQQALAANRVSLADEPAAPQKRTRRQASPLADQLRALLESDPTLGVPDLMEQTGACRAYCQRAKRLMREERSA
jgi:hypothetical protein